MKRYTVLHICGSYGTYLAWCFYTYSNLNYQNNITLNYNDNGNMLYRLYEGWNIVNIAHDFYHPDVHFENIIHINADRDNFIEYMNNNFYVNQNNKEILPSYLNEWMNHEYKNKMKSYDLEIAEPWVNRELLSFFLEDYFHATEQNHKNIDYDKINVFKCTRNDILYKMENLLENLYDFFNLEKNANFKLVSEIHSKWLQTQKNINKDLIIKQFVFDVLHNNENNISNLSIFDEAWIQHLLRQNGFEIQCFQLNKFPCNSFELRKIIYKA